MFLDGLKELTNEVFRKLICNHTSSHGSIHVLIGRSSLCNDGLRGFDLLLSSSALTLDFFGFLLDDETSCGT